MRLTSAITTLHEQYPLAETVIIGGAILLITWFVEHQAVKIINRLVMRDGAPIPAGSIFANIARVGIWFAGVAVLCQVCFGYDISAFIAALGVGGIALSLGMQDTLSNLIGGLQISLGRIVDLDDYVEVLGQSGKVVDIGWRHTTIVDAGGATHFIPNSLINRNSLVAIGGCNDVHVPFVVPVHADVDAFSAEAVSRIADAMGIASSPEDVRVLFTGQTADGLCGNAVVRVKRAEVGAEAVADTVVRALDPLIKSIERA